MKKKRSKSLPPESPDLLTTTTRPNTPIQGLIQPPITPLTPTPFLRVTKAPKTPQKPQEDSLVPDITTRLSRLSLEANTPTRCNNPQKGQPSLRSSRDTIDRSVSPGDINILFLVKIIAI